MKTIILRELGLFSVEEEMLRGDFSNVYKYLMAASKENITTFFSWHPVTG